MKKTNETVIKETKYILSFTIALSVIMQIVFVVLKHWDYTVLLGNILGATTSTANFFLMGKMVQKAVGKEQDEIKRIVKNSQTLRTFFMLVTIVIGVTVPIFSTVAAIVPLFFPRIAIALRPLWKENRKNEQ